MKSTALRECRHGGDVTIAINCQAFQVEGPDWTKFSDAHDVVIAPVCLEAIHTSTPEPQVGASAVQPATQASVQSAKQVADQRAAERATGHNVHTAVSAEQPAKQDNVNMAAAQLHVLQNQMPADKSNTSLNATKLPSAQVKEEPVQSAALSAIVCAEGYPPGQNTQAASSGEQRARQESATELLDPQVQQNKSS